MRVHAFKAQGRAGAWSCLPGRQGAQRAHSHGVLGSSPAHVVESYGQRAVAVQQVVRHHEGEGGRDAKVRHEADEQRGHDADGDGSLGVLHLFTWGGDGEQTQLNEAERTTLLIYDLARCSYFWHQELFLACMRCYKKNSYILYDGQVYKTL